MAEEIKLKYRWRKTWPDSENDFLGKDGDETIGRFYLHRAAEGLRWYWHMQWDANGRERVQLSGLCEKPREAAQKIEQNYDRLRELLKMDEANRIAKSGSDDY